MKTNNKLEIIASAEVQENWSKPELQILMVKNETLGTNSGPGDDLNTFS